MRIDFKGIIVLLALPIAVLAVGTLGFMMLETRSCFIKTTLCNLNRELRTILNKDLDTKTEMHTMGNRNQLSNSTPQYFVIS